MRYDVVCLDGRRSRQPVALYTAVSVPYSMAVLTAEQHREFVRNGFLVLRDAVDGALIESVRAAVEDAETGEGNQNEPDAATGAVRELNRHLFAYADELVGGDRLKHPDDGDWGTYSDEQARIGLHTPGDERLTDAGAQSDASLGVHVDDLTDGAGALYALGAATYLDRVGPRDGGFTVWPGSHWVAAEHCELARPDTDAPQGTRARAQSVQIRADSEFDSVDDLYEHFCPFEVAGDAGTVTLWHGALVHSAGRQLSPGSLRMAAFSRFHIREGNWDPDAVAHPFAYWTGLDGTESPAGRSHE
jgi:hypothetical protein